MNRATPHRVNTPGGGTTAAPWGITLDHVTVRYPGGTLGLDDVSLHIPAGEMVAIVGLWVALPLATSNRHPR